MKKFLTAIALAALVATVACNKPEDKAPVREAPKVVEETTTTSTTSTTATTASTGMDTTAATATTATTTTTASTTSR